MISSASWARADRSRGCRKASTAPVPCSLPPAHSVPLLQGHTGLARLLLLLLLLPPPPPPPHHHTHHHHHPSPPRLCPRQKRVGLGRRQMLETQGGQVAPQQHRLELTIARHARRRASIYSRHPAIRSPTALTPSGLASRQAGMPQQLLIPQRHRASPKRRRLPRQTPHPEEGCHRPTMQHSHPLRFDLPPDLPRALPCGPIPPSL